MGTWNSGLLEFEGRDLLAVYNQNNSSLQNITKDGWVRIGGCCFDEQNSIMDNKS